MAAKRTINKVLKGTVKAVFDLEKYTDKAGVERSVRTLIVNYKGTDLAMKVNLTTDKQHELTSLVERDDEIKFVQTGKIEHFFEASTGEIVELKTPKFTGKMVAIESAMY